MEWADYIDDMKIEFSILNFLILVGNAPTLNQIFECLLYSKIKDGFSDLSNEVFTSNSNIF